MKKIYWDEIGYNAVGLLTTLFVICMIAFAVKAVLTEKLCLENGYANSNLAIDFTGYCIREENEYEITIPLKELLNQ